VHRAPFDVTDPAAVEAAIGEIEDTVGAVQIA